MHKKWYGLLFLLCLLAPIANAQTFKANFDKANNEVRTIMCVPVLAKMYNLSVVSLVNKKRRGEDLSDVHKIAMNLGYRAETFKRIAERDDAELLKVVWQESSEEYENKKADYSSMTGKCVVLYNDMQRTGKVNSTLEKKSVDKIAAELAQELTKN